MRSHQHRAVAAKESRRKGKGTVPSERGSSAVSTTRDEERRSTAALPSTSCKYLHLLITCESYSSKICGRTASPSTPKKRPSSNSHSNSLTPTGSSPPSSDLDIESPTRRLSSPQKRRQLPTSLIRSVPLLSLFATHSAASSLLSTCQALTRLSPSFTLPDLVHLSRSLQENAQMLAIAQAQSLSNGRTFGSSFDTLARTISASSPRSEVDPSASALVAAKALDLYKLPSEDERNLPDPATPTPLLILTTPRTVCLQCESALTLRSKPSGPYSLVSPSEPVRPVLVASHVCTNGGCRARHAPDHVEIVQEGRKVWIWEEGARYHKVGEAVWVTKGFSMHFAALLLQQCVSPGGYARVWNSLHGESGEEEAEGSEGGPGEEVLDEEEEDERPRSRFKLSSAHVWRSFVIHSSIEKSLQRGHRLVTTVRPSSETLVRFVNLNLFASKNEVHLLDPHTCKDCSRDRRLRWKGGKASEEEEAGGLKWGGKSEIQSVSCWSFSSYPEEKES